MKLELLFSYNLFKNLTAISTSLYESSVEFVRPSVHQVRRFNQSEKNFSTPNYNFINEEYFNFFIMRQTFGLAELLTCQSEAHSVSRGITA